MEAGAKEEPAPSGASATGPHLIQAEGRYRALVESIPAVAYLCGLGDDGDWLYVSPQIEPMLGYTPQEWLAHPHPFSSFVHPEDLDRALGAEAESAATGGVVKTEYRMLTRDGRIVWIEDQAAIVRDEDGVPLVLQGVLLDVTERKRAEERVAELSEREREAEAERRRLLDRTLRAAEEERTRLAAELHDGPVQRLARLGYALERVRMRLEMDDAETASALLERAQDGVFAEVAEIRRMMARLRPPVLDHMGLEDALRDRALAIGEEAGLRCEVEARLDGRLAPSLETVLYRVSQEALTNVAKHADATSAHVSLHRSNGSVILEVRDDGVGFDPSLAEPGADHFGLMAMRERVEMVGGTWELRSRPGRGTAIKAVLPWEEASR